MAISFVQFAHNSQFGSGTLTATLGSAPTAGNVLVAITSEFGFTHAPAHTGDAFSLLETYSVSGQANVHVYAAVVQSGSTSTTVTCSTAGNGATLLVYEISGLSRLTDGFQATHSTSSPVAPSSITTANANDILIAASFAVPQTSGAAFTALSAPWTNEVAHTATASLWGYDSGYRIVSSTGTYTYSQTWTPNSEAATAFVVALRQQQPAPVNSAAPVASGTATVGNALSVTTGTWTNYGTAAYTYQWQRDNLGGGTFSNIAGAVSNNYTLVDADDACKIRCVVTNTDEFGSGTANSNQLGAVVEPSPVNTVAPAVSGFGYVGYTLTVTNGTWTGMGGHTATYTYQWQRDNSGGGTYSNRSGETASTYVAVTGDLGCNIRCVVTATNDAAGVTANSNAVGLIAAAPAAPSNTVAPVASGTVDVGLTVTSDTGTWANTPTSYSYQWQRDDNGGGSYTDIPSATAATYTIVDADQGCQIRCTVTATNVGGSGTAESNALEWVDFFLSATVKFGDSFQELGTGAAGGSSRVQQVTVSRGRQNALDQISAGQCTYLFVNADGALDPSNIDSPYYQQILPLVECRVRRRFNGQSFWLFNGRVEDWQPQYLPPSAQLMQVPASDAFERLNNTPLVSGYGSLTTALAGSNNDLTFTSVQGGAIGDQTTVTYVVAGSSTPLSTATNAPIPGGAVLYAHAIARARGVTRVGLGSGVGQIPAAPPSSVTVTGTDITVDVATNSGGTATSTASLVLAAMEASPDVSALVSVALAAGNTGAGTVTAMAAGTLTGGLWPQELTGARIGRVLDTVGWDVDLRALDTGTVQVVPKGFAKSDHASALQHLQNVADAELGYVFVDGAGVFTFHDANHRNTAARSTISQCTFADDGSGFKYEQSPQPNFSKDKIINQATVTGGGSTAIPQTVDDTYSQTGVGTPPTGATGTPDSGFGVRALQRSTELAANADALAQAQLVVDLFAYPKVRFDSITSFEPADDDLLHDAWVASVLGLEIGDLVTVKVTPPATEAASSYQAFVEQVTDTVVVGQRWKRSFQLSSRTQTSGGGGGGSGHAMLNTLGGTLILNDPTNGVIGTG